MPIVEIEDKESLLSMALQIASTVVDRIRKLQ